MPDILIVVLIGNECGALIRCKGGVIREALKISHRTLSLPSHSGAMTKPKVSGTTLIHGDSAVNGGSKTDVAPPISVTTSEDRVLRYWLCLDIGLFAAFRTPHGKPPAAEGDIDFRNPPSHVYSRYTQDISTRAEHILSEINVCAPSFD
jgi:hypothetical protein